MLPRWCLCCHGGASVATVMQCCHGGASVATVVQVGALWPAEHANRDRDLCSSSV